jgi:hypothetical protein
VRSDPSPTDPRSRYSERLTFHGALRDAAAARSKRLSNVRLLTAFLIIAAWAAFDATSGWARVLALVVAIALVAAFLIEVGLHRRARRTERWEGALADVANEGLLRLSRDWAGLQEALPPREREIVEVGPGHAYARDLSVTGRTSLQRLAGPVTSERGRAVLLEWLLNPGASEDATARQGAVRELSAAHAIRDQLTAIGRIGGPATLSGLTDFFAWSEGEPWIGERKALRVISWVSPVLLVGGVIGYFALGWPPWLIVPALVQLELLRRNHARLSETLARAASGGPSLRALVPQVALVANHERVDPALRDIGARIGRGEAGAASHLRALSKILDTIESRRNAFYVVFALVFMADVHLCVRLDRWRAAHGPQVRDWLEALGEWEALSALAAIAHDHPQWAFPVFTTTGSPQLVAQALGHPLLPQETCVRNDVSLGPPGSFLLVTGSNMSGKSTLLRAIGANAVLAAAGAPVCANALALPPVRIHTSMRIEDSLTEGVSLFMAELLRIKQVIEAADAADAQAGTALYLLDEILNGTNTAERRIAARAVLRRLLAAGAIGAVSTHDLTLADAPDLVRAARMVHFREEVTGVEVTGGVTGGRAASGDVVAARALRDPAHPTALTFDYRLRPGLATTRNALKLLEAVGLGGVELEESRDGTHTEP